MAAAQATPHPDIAFFGTCPTGWTNLTWDEKERCIGIRLSRQIQGFDAWTAVGELLEQWNEFGNDEFSAVIRYCESKRFYLGRPNNPSHQLRILSLPFDKPTAHPYIIIDSKDEKAAKAIVERLEKHPRLCRIGFKYIAHKGKMTLSSTASEFFPSINIPETGDNNNNGFLPRSQTINETLVETQDRNTSPKDDLKPVSKPASLPEYIEKPASQPAVVSSLADNLCGARIAIYAHTGLVRGEKKNVSTIGAVIKIGTSFYALTVAHAFFDNIDTTQSWTDSGLSVWTDSGSARRRTIPKPRISDAYEIVIESIWPHRGDIYEASAISPNAIGLVAPSVANQRKTPLTESYAKVFWDPHLDWALIELKQAALWKPNCLRRNDHSILTLKGPQAAQNPPSGEVILATGVSGNVQGIGLGTVGGVLLPWSSTEIRIWSVESEIGKWQDDN